ncbi:protein of unknown function [Xenorhabdus doucetiae]|uniref:Uncharacterized protein n=1 Tax=Xenorhabdus doucetiae TaxID=351671 RepID=A0A068QP53_9GAMM|nr:protein of unknown function [Xenorhabdus doucetiae]
MPEQLWKYKKLYKEQRITQA